MIRLSLSFLTVAALALFFVPARAGEGAKALKGTFAGKLMDEKWTITFDGDSKFTVKQKDKLMVEGIYKLTKDHVSFTDKKGPIASVDKTGTYKWKLDGKKLTFTKVEDAVEGREMALTGSAWTSEK